MIRDQRAAGATIVIPDAAGTRSSSRAFGRSTVDHGGPAAAHAFWLVVRAWSLVWMAFLLLVGVLGADGAGDVYYGSLLMGSSALLVALIGERRGAGPGLTPSKFFMALTLISSTVVYGSLLLVGVADPVFRFIERGPPMLVMSGMSATYFAAVALGLRLASPGPLRSREKLPGPPTRRSFARPRDTQIAWAAVLLGAIAMLVRFPTLSSVVAYWSGDIRSAESVGLLGLFSALCRPFLAVGTALLLARWSDGSRLRRIVAAIATALVALLVLGTYGLNRAAVVAPALAILLLLGDQRARIRWGLLSIAGVAGVWLLSAAGEFRRVALVPSSVEGGPPTPGATATESVQVYGQAPQFAAVVVDSADSFRVVSLLADVLSPLPGIPDALRELSGTAAYNAVLYGSGNWADQILPTWAHLWAVGGPPAVVLAGIAIGCLAGVVARRMSAARGPISRYALALLSVWLLVSPYYSWLALSQAIFYFCAPVLFLGWLSSAGIGPRSGEEDVVGRRSTS